MDMLAVLVVLALVPTWSDGMLLKKCELKSQLQAAFSELQREKVDDIIAKCELIGLITETDITLRSTLKSHISEKGRMRQFMR